MLHQLAVLLFLALVPVMQAGGQAAGGPFTTTLTIELKANGEFGGELEFALSGQQDEIRGRTYTMDLPFQIDGTITATGLAVSPPAILHDRSSTLAPEHTLLTLRDMDPSAPERKASFQIRPTQIPFTSPSAPDATFNNALMQDPSYVAIRDAASGLAAVERSLYVKVGKPRTAVDLALTPTVLALFREGSIAEWRFDLGHGRDVDSGRKSVSYPASRLEEDPLIVSYTLPIPDARGILLALLPMLIAFVGCPMPLVLVAIPDLIRNRLHRMGIAMGIAFLALLGGTLLWTTHQIGWESGLPVIALCAVTLIAVPLIHAVRSETAEGPEGPASPPGDLAGITDEDLAPRLSGMTDRELARLLKRAWKTRSILEIQRATHTDAYVPPAILIGIDDQEQLIAGIQAEKARRRPASLQTQPATA